MRKRASLTIAFFLSLTLQFTAAGTQSLADIKYSKPGRAGLVAIRAYPHSNDVCRLLRVTKNIKQYNKNGTRLIACPMHENGAISDRKKQGARYVGRRGNWLILRIRGG